MRVRVVDRGGAALVRRIRDMSATITVGVHAADGQKHYDGGTSVVDAAIANEFGTDTIPQRSFVRAWFDENRTRNEAAIRRMLISVLTGKRTREQALALLGQTFVGQVQRKIAQGIPPPNSPVTIARKDSSKPLIEGGQLRTSVSYEVDGERS